MHATADTTAVKFRQRLGAARDARRGAAAFDVSMKDIFLKRALTVALLLFVGVVASFARGSESRKLFPVVRNKKWGFIDVKGQTVIPLQFDYARDFSEGLAAAGAGDKWGYIDETGRWAIEPKYESALPFSEGLAQVRVGGQWSSEPVYLIGGKTSYIDRTGKVVFTLPDSPLGTSYDDYTFSEGLLPLALSRDKYGYVDKTGRMAIEPKFDYAGDFSEGLAGVWVGDFIGFIDRTGKFAIKPKFPIAGWGRPNSFSEGLVTVPVGEMMGFVDKTGKIVIAPRFYRADSFSEGLAAVQLTERENLDGYIDKTGKIIIKPQFEIGGHFREGLAAVRINGKWGYIDKSGKVVIQPQFSEAQWFSGGLAQVRVGGRLGYINAAGSYVWRPTN
ncbi:MAG: WG repeat-containing protein [Acidobacteriota bacterium]|nr:WG repeat-containing protein [Acidobacteriota bacterium]